MTCSLRSVGIDFWGRPNYTSFFFSRPRPDLLLVAMVQGKFFTSEPFEHYTEVHFVPSVLSCLRFLYCMIYFCLFSFVLFC
jgi:hypothetical protein